MKATNEKKSEGYSSPYDFEGRIPLSQAIPLGLQHVMAMFIGNLTPLIIVMGVCGLTADAGFGELRTALLQNAMIIAGVVTLVQMFSIGPVGGKAVDNENLPCNPADIPNAPDNVPFLIERKNDCRNLRNRN